MPNWLIVLGVMALAAGIVFFIKKKHDDDDDDDNEVTVVEDNPEEEENMKKFALIVGINNYATAGMDLEGCVNDANNMKAFLTECAGFEEAGIKMLLNSQATKANILSHLEWLVSKGADGVELFYYHSGHGSQVTDVSGDESDQLDEILIPYDHSWSDPLLDDYVSKIFAKLPSGAFLSMICDTCHSGSMTKDVVRNIAMPEKMAEKMVGKVFKLKRFGVKKDIQRHILLSGCKDTQTSSEAIISGVRQGALTYNFLKVARASAQSWKDTHAQMIANMQSGGWSQDPVLSGDDDLQNRIVLGMAAGSVCTDKDTVELYDF
jgi:hypothetical protein